MQLVPTICSHCALSVIDNIGRIEGLASDDKNLEGISIFPSKAKRAIEYHQRIDRRIGLESDLCEQFSGSGQGRIGISGVAGVYRSRHIKELCHSVSPLSTELIHTMTKPNELIG